MVDQASGAAGGAFNWKWFLLSIEGRVPRSWYWLRFILPYIGLMIVAVLLDFMFGTYDPEQGIGMISGLLGLAALWPSIATGVKRLHDRNRSGWFYLILLVPIVGFFYWLIDIGILKGTTGPNRFGPDPLGGAH